MLQYLPVFLNWKTDPWKGGNLVLHTQKLTGVHAQFKGFFKHSVNVSCISDFSRQKSDNKNNAQSKLVFEKSDVNFMISLLDKLYSVLIE